MKTLLIIVWVLFIAVFIGIIRAEIYKSEAVDAIVGEASNQSPETMACIAHAIRNRGTLKGVYGSHARHNANEPEEVWDNARDAWDISLYTRDKTHGSKNFGVASDRNVRTNLKRIKAQCGDFYFY